MSTQQKPPTEITAKQAAAYLEAHTDFLASRPKLLALMTVPHQTGAAVSLVERQVAVLREQRDQAQDKLRELIAIAQDNDQLGERMHQLVLSLLNCDSLVAVLDALHDCLIGVFQAERVDLYLFSDQVEGEPVEGIAYLDRTDGDLGDFDHIINSRKPICGRLTADQLAALYGEAQSTIGSAAVVPLTGEKSIGLLAIGSEDANRFLHGMDTVFLDQLGGLIYTALMRHLSAASERQSGQKAD